MPIDPSGKPARDLARTWGLHMAIFVIGDYMTEEVFPNYSPPRSSLLSKGEWKRRVEARLRHGTDFLDSFRFWRHAVQLLGSNRTFSRSGNFADVPKLGRQLGVDVAADVLRSSEAGAGKKIQDPSPNCRASLTTTRQ
jgi:hypothetical protein